MGEFVFYAAPNIFGDPSDPPYQYGFHRSEVIGDTTYVLSVPAEEVASMPYEEWYDFLESTWVTHIKDARA